MPIEDYKNRKKLNNVNWTIKDHISLRCNTK